MEVTRRTDNCKKGEREREREKERKREKKEYDSQ